MNQISFIILPTKSVADYSPYPNYVEIRSNKQNDTMISQSHQLAHKTTHNVKRSQESYKKDGKGRDVPIMYKSQCRYSNKDEEE